MNLNQLIKSLHDSNKIVIADNYHTLTGKQLADAIKGKAFQLRALGIQDKRICLLRMTNTVDSVVLLFAALCNQAVVFISNPHDPIGKVCETIEKFPIFAVLTDRATAITVQKKTAHHLPPQTEAIRDSNFYALLFESNNHEISHYDSNMEAADIAIFSSGSTGEPKAILHKFETLMLNAQLHMEAIALSNIDKIGIVLPLYYSYGLVANLFSGLLAGAEINLSQQIGMIDTGWIDSNEISVLSVTPFIAKKIQHRNSSLQTLTVGGDVFYSKDAKRLLNLYSGSAIFSTYGLTEAGPRVSTCRIDPALVEKNTILPLGSPLRGVKLSIENQSNHGELQVDTPTHMLGYYLGTGSKFTSQSADGGSLIKTGDIYEIVDDSYYFVGRMKKIIFQGGEKVFPLMVESVIHDIEGVLDVMVTSAHDQNKGQVAKAYIVTNNNLTLQDVRKLMKQRLCSSLIPEQLEFVDSIPRTVTGKIRAEQLSC